MKIQGGAAVKIQAVGASAARKEVDRGGGAQGGAGGCRHQAVHRGKAARKEVEERKEQEAAAVKIQAVHRGKAARKEVEERKEQEAAAVKIQAVHTGARRRAQGQGGAQGGAQGRARRSRSAAAVKIQAVHRGKAAQGGRSDRGRRCTGARRAQGSLRSPSVEAFLPLDGSPFLFIDATDADDSKAFGVAGHVLSLARLGALDFRVSRLRFVQEARHRPRRRRRAARRVPRAAD